MSDTPKKKPRGRWRDEDRFIEAMNAIDRRAEAFVLITAERGESGILEPKVYTSDDLTGERLLTAGSIQYEIDYPFGPAFADLDDTADESPDHDEDEE
jgi:hypothetical protein